MNTRLAFELPDVWVFGLPLALSLLLFVAWRQSRRGLVARRIALLIFLRFAAFIGLLFLLARPARFHQQALNVPSRPVLVLLDRSESMSLKESDTTRFARATEFLSRRLLPALKSANVAVHCMVFDQNVQEVTDSEIAATLPNGKRTDLGAAIAQAIGGSSQPPLAVIALTDGAANCDIENERALSVLLEAGTPFIGVGFGEDRGVQTLSLRKWSGPVSAAPRIGFSLTAELEVVNADQRTSCELLLFRDGRLLQSKTLQIEKGGATRTESFQVSEEAAGIHNYSVQLVPPNLPNLTCVNTKADTSVRISDSRDLRVLYVQGALTWEYKFINLALHKDPNVKITGLTRTSEQSVFRQNIEGTGELVNGFPTSLDQLTPFRVVVLSNLRPQDLSSPQQELLARFCSELGGGILMIGGASTFDRAWQNTRLEQLLPVLLAADSRPVRTNAFRPQLTAEALQCPIFRLTPSEDVARTWNRLPLFDQYARVGDAKLGAQVWMVRPDDDSGPGGILMASQRYGAGISAAVCLQNFWRWRLAKDTETEQFDRFWRQLFRWLGDSSRDEVSIEVADQELRPEQDVHLVVERRLSPQNSGDSPRNFIVQVRDGRNQLVQEETVELQTGHPVEFRFRAARPDLYSVTITDPAKVVVAARPVEVRDLNVELVQTARNMETLRQWASMSDGLAFKAEECPRADDLVAQIKAKVRQVQTAQQTRQVVGLQWPI